tara:strand:- start:51446 stop:51904 length:459 start_codon:yes stop_codon:yes gene_type:complete
MEPIGGSCVDPTNYSNGEHICHGDLNSTHHYPGHSSDRRGADMAACAQLGLRPVRPPRGSALGRYYTGSHGPVLIAKLPPGGINRSGGRQRNLKYLQASGVIESRKHSWETRIAHPPATGARQQYLRDIHNGGSAMLAFCRIWASMNVGSIS